MSASSGLHGVMAEFSSPRQLVAAIRRARGEGYEKMDAYTPYPIEEVIHALGHHHSKVSLLVLLGGITGALGGFGLQYWISAIAYPLNVGGRPLNSWPAFIPVTFECTILVAAFAAVVGMILLNGLPRPHHPVFNVDRFALHASSVRYFLCLEADGPDFDPAAARRFLEGLDAVEVNEVDED